MNPNRLWKAVWLALMLWLPASLLQADSVTVTITVDNGYGFGYGDSNGIYAGQYYGGIDNCYSSQIFGSPCYVFVGPDNPQGATDTGAEIYNITAGSNDYIYIVAWSDDSALQGTVATFTDNTSGTTVTTSPAWPWQVFATGTNWAPNCNPTGAHGPPLTGFPYAISNQIAAANASAGGPGTSVTWVNNTGGANGRLDFSGQYNGNAYYYPPPACLASGALWMEYNPEPRNPGCNPFVWGSVSDYGSIPNFLREYLIYRIGPLGQLASSNCLQLQCPANKTVPCGTNWTFDWPTASSCCTNEFLTAAGTLTNLLIIPTGAVTNGACPRVTITQTWEISDGCGDSTNCSQTVTVTGCCTNCLQVACPPNKTVLCSSDWTFDQPVAVSCCTNEFGSGGTGPETNVVITSTGIVTNGSCPEVYITQTWQITDACGESTNCSQTVVVLGCCSNCATECCGPNLGPKTIQWLQLPTNVFFHRNPLGDNKSNTWIITNLPCYGNVLVTEDPPTNVIAVSSNGDFGAAHAISSFAFAPNTNGMFNFTESVPGTYGPYSWGATPGAVELGYRFPYTNAFGQTAPLPSYNVTFYFLDGQPNPCSLIFSAIGLAQSTTNTVSQPLTFRTEYDLSNNPVNYPTGPSADTVLNSTFGPSLSSNVSGTVITSAYDINGGDDFNTGWSIFQPASILLTTNLPPGSGTDINGNPYPASNSYPYLQVTINQELDDDFSVTVGYICCPSCGSNCFQTQCPTNKTVPCGTTWSFDPPTATSCCPAVFGAGPAGPGTNVLITSVGFVTNGSCPLEDITETWLITDGCGDTNYCSQTVTVIGCCTNTCIELTCPSDIVVTTCSNCADVFYSAIATNSCCFSNVALRYNPASGYCFPLGSNTVQVTAYDPDCASTPPVMCNFTVTVLPGTNCPSNCLTVLCPTDKTVKCGSGWTFDMPTATSCCTNFYDAPPGEQPTNVLILPMIPVTNGSCPLVTITQTWTISDLCGDSTNCSQVVTVEGCCTSCLELQCPSNIVVTTCSNCAPVFFSATATACCTNVAELVYSLPSGYCFPIGTTNVQVSAYACGYVTNCEFTVTVLPCESNSNICSNGCLTISTPANIVVYSCTNVPVFYNPTALDTCCNGNLSITCTPSSGSYFAPGTTTTVTCAVLDYCGLSNNCQFTVTVICTNCLVVDCPTNKTVECGTKWAFDLPRATSCCATNVKGSKTNVAIITTSTVTNGVCPQFITNTWLIIDGCGNTATCSQTVDVVDTTPPMINCPSNAVVVALNTNCDLVIPRISVTATDNCTPPCDLVYSQSPLPGTIVFAHNAYVTITVTDLCGNSNSCVVEVIGEPVAGLSVDWPANVTVTNCLVPCIHVTATDCACPLMIPHVTQSPPCGTPVGPGVNSVTVTVTDCMGATATKVIPLIIAGEESFLSALANTGISSTGTLLAQSAIDPHYSLGPVAGSPPGYTAPNALVVTNAWPWLEVTHVSQWIAPNTDLPPGFKLTQDATGYYTYTNKFMLPAGANPATASISGRWAADDGAVLMKINTTITGNTIPASGSSGFAGWHYFTINSGFIPGLNTILFVVTNGAIYVPSPTGLRVEYTNASVCSTCAPPYIISISGSQSLQEGSTATFTVKAGGTPPLSYQWQFNENDIEGATNSVLQLPSIGYANAGLYTVNIANPCGGGTGIPTGQVSLLVTPALPWPNASWNVSDLSNPLGATFGPDLILAGADTATNFGISDGTTEDFGLPNPGGQIVNTMDINPMEGAAIELPVIAPSGTASDNCYTLIMDIYEPDTSLGTPSTLYESIACCISNLGSSGQDGVGLTLDVSNILHITGSTDGTPFDYAATAPMPVDAWNRVAFVVDDPQDGIGANMTAYLNGGIAININPCPCCVIPFTNINWGNGSPTLLTAPTTAPVPNAEFYVSSIQFHAKALDSQMIAGIGSPVSGPPPMNKTSVGPSPGLSAALVNGAVNISWSGSPYRLQETTDLGSGVWTNSELPFTETSGTTGNLLTTAVVNPTPGAPGKFYRLIFAP